jgi:hypothetical protein
MLAQPQRLRRLAVHVLLVWLFALGTGIVNACVVQVQLHQAAHSVAHGHADMEAAPDEGAVPAATEHQHHQHEHQADRSHPPCERLCDAPSVAPQPEKQLSNLLSGFWLAPAPIPSFNFQSSIEPDRIVPSTHVRWRKSIPIPIAFLRLAL